MSIDPLSDPFSKFTRVVIDCMSVNLNSLNANEQSEYLWLHSTQKLNESWNSGSNQTIEDLIKKDLPAISNLGAGSRSQALTDWLGKAFSGDIKLSQWSAAEIAAAMTAIGKIVPPPDGQAKTDWNTNRSQAISTLQQYNGVLTAQQASETSTGDTEGKAMASVIQNVTAQQTPIKDACDAFLGVLNAFASLLSSI